MMKLVSCFASANPLTKESSPMPSTSQKYSDQLLEFDLIKFTFTLAIIASGFEFFCATQYIHYISDIFFFPPLLIVFALIYKNFRSQTNLKIESTTNYEKLLFIVVFGIIISINLRLLNKESIWFDEDYQIKLAYDYGAVEAGAWQHQPPLDMALGNMIVRLCGFSEFSYRFFAVFFSSAATSLFTVLAKRLSGSLIISILSGLFYFYEPFVNYFARGGRPVSLGLFATMLILSFPLRMIAGSYHRSRKEWVACLSAALFGLYSLGLQIPFLLLSLILITFWYRKKFPFTSLHLISAWVTALLIYLPVQVLIFMIAPRRFRHLEDIDFRKIALLETLPSLFNNYLLPAITAFGLACIFILIGKALSKIFRKDLTLDKTAAEQSRFLALVGVTFLVSLVVFFKCTIEWQMNYYYFILFWPCMILSSCALYGALLKPIALLYSGIIAAITAIIALLICNTNIDWMRSYRSEYGYHKTYREAYEAISTLNLKGSGVLLNFCLRNNAGYCPKWVVGAKIYLDPISKRPGGQLQYSKDSIADGLVNFMRSSYEPDWIYILFDRSPNDLKFQIQIQDQFPEITRREFGPIILLIAPNTQKNSRQLLGRIFGDLNKKLDRSGIYIEPAISWPK